MKLFQLSMVVIIGSALVACGGGGNTPASNTPASNTPASNTPTSSGSSTLTLSGSVAKTLSLAPSTSIATTTYNGDSYGPVAIATVFNQINADGTMTPIGVGSEYSRVWLSPPATSAATITANDTYFGVAVYIDTATNSERIKLFGGVGAAAAGNAHYAIPQICRVGGAGVGASSCLSKGIVFDRIAGSITFTNTVMWSHLYGTPFSANGTPFTVNGTLNFVPF